MWSLRRSTLAVGVAVVAGWSCGGSSPSPTTPTPQAITIIITGQRGALSFSPNPATAGGQLVVFRNNDTEAHSVRLNDGTVNWGTIQPGATSQAFRMPAEGTNYHCNLHPAMIGAVNAETGGQPPPCRDYC
jgi:plastocyanin